MTKSLKVMTKTPAEIAERFLTIKTKREKVAELKKQLDGEYALLRDSLLDTTKKLGVLTLKTEKYTIMRKKSTRPSIVDHQKAIADMADKGLEPILKLDYYANASALKGVDIDGVEQVESEYVVIKENKESK